MTLRVRDHDQAVRKAMEVSSELDIYSIVRIQDRRDRTVAVTNAATDSVSSEFLSGAGVQVFTTDGLGGFACSDTVTPDSLAALTACAASLARASRGRGAEACMEIFKATALQCDMDRVVPAGFDQVKVELEEDAVLAVNRESTAVDPRLAARTFYRITDEQWRIARSDGTDVSFSMARAVVMNSVTARDGDRAATVNTSVSGEDASVLLSPHCREVLRKRTERAAGMALGLLTAARVRAGNYRIVLDYALAKGLAHEAFGHAAESDAMETSILGREGVFRAGERVASDIVTIVDGPIPRDYAYQPISANGIRRETVEIVRRGVLSQALSDVFSAARAGVGITGAGRAESYRHLPIPRMTNTRITVEDPLPIGKRFEDVTPEDVRDVLDSAGLLTSDPP
ncbi:MAG: TldD/PmbA family protein, partial [Firmicutes bacterium]|nr:TldD/PmbA family protein [Bacillota bacterium]